MKRLHLLLCLVALPALAQAQTVKLGLEVGVSYVSFDYEEASMRGWKEVGGRPSFSVMAAVMLPLWRNDLSMQSGLRFARLGNRVEYDYRPVDGARGTFETTQNYLFVPFRLQYHIAGGPVYLMTGPGVGYMLSAQSRNTIYEVHCWGDKCPEDRFPYSRSTPITDEVERFNLVLTGGVGASLSLYGRQVYLEISYSKGMVEAASEENWRSSWQTRELLFSMGYVF